MNAIALVDRSTLHQWRGIGNSSDLVLGGEAGGVPRPAL
jgi:hypothetical protein